MCPFGTMQVLSETSLDNVKNKKNISGGNVFIKPTV
jgi:hypothetical protein